jgi:uncharacterized protein with ParB-like and HNH nuclease domain
MDNIDSGKENLKELEEENFIKEDEGERQALEIPPKDRKLVTHPFDYIIRSLSAQIDDGSLVLQDKFQRRRVWDDIKSSRLIESLLLNVPIPVCYFAELDNSIYSVIDGQQRLTAIYRFVKNEFPLKGLRVRPELNRKRFFELDSVDQRLLNNRTIRCIVVLKESHQDIRFDVFERLNTGSVKLNTQELRNSMYRGKLNDLLKELSENSSFMQARKVSDIDKRMQDCELILRFFAFYFKMPEYKGDFAKFLDDYLKSGMKLNDEQLEQHRKLFTRVIEDVLYVFEHNSFRRFTERSDSEGLVNRAIYDVIMLSFAYLDSNAIRTNKSAILMAFKNVCQDDIFKDAVTSSTKDKKKIRDRLLRWNHYLNQQNIKIDEFSEWIIRSLPTT